MTKKLSTVAWQQIYPIYLSLQQHRFNQQLRDGSLPPEIFRRFLIQDAYYLKSLARCFGIIGRKLPSHSHFFLSYEEDGFKDEMDLINHYLKDDFESRPLESGAVNNSTQNITPATRDYADGLLYTAACEPPEIALAHLLACFRYFLELSIWMNATTIRSIPNHPQALWINTYSDESFRDSVDHFTRIYDEVASFASKTIQQRMLAASVKGAKLELRFIDEIYCPPRHSLSLFKNTPSTAPGTPTTIDLRHNCRR